MIEIRYGPVFKDLYLNIELCSMLRRIDTSSRGSGRDLQNILQNGEGATDVPYNLLHLRG